MPQGQMLFQNLSELVYSTSNEAVLKVSTYSRINWQIRKQHELEQSHAGEYYYL